MRGRRLRATPPLLVSVLAASACVSIPPGTHPAPAPGPPIDGAAQPTMPAEGQAARDPGYDPIPEDCDTEGASPKRQMRGAWLTTVRNIDWPSEPGLDAEEQQAELRSWLDQAAELNLNAVFFHVRPTTDAVYDSELEPWARYLTGEQGGDPGYDPLAYAVEQAHQRGLELHAWFNPYRVGWEDPDLANLVDEHPAARNPEWLIVYDEQGYLDPGNPEVREWVGNVVLDVVERYDIDGVHFDDYFYPYPGGGGDFDDDASWAAHGDGFDSRAAWRRDNVNTLVSEVHERIQETKPWVQFGISPFGVWRNASSDSSGSDTQALQSYDDQYADTRAWIREGWVDYVAPQLYWERGHDRADYEVLVPWWVEQVEDTGVDLYIGQAAYRVGEPGWTEDTALTRQLDFSSDYPAVAGDIYFSMKSLTEVASGAMEEVLQEHYARPALPPAVDGATQRPTPVTDLRAEPDGSRIQLRWSAPEGARSFAIYRVTGEDPGSDLCALASATHLIDVVGAGEEGTQSYTDPNAPEGAAHYFVTALDANRVESAPGPGVAVD